MYLCLSSLTSSAASGADVRRLATGIVPPTSDVVGPVWSPDGSSIAVSTASAAGSAIEIVPVNGAKAHVAFDGAGQNVDPSWSRDGSTLAFERDDAGRWTIWLVAPDGTAPREAIATGANNRFPQWSPADDRLAFLSDRGGGYALYVGMTDGSAQKLVGGVAPDSPARWSPDASALAVSSVGNCRRFGITVVRPSAPTRPLRRSNQCRIDGTAGDDFIYGTPYYDLIDGAGGNDSLFAGNGDDVVDGGPGNDHIGGGPGNDVIDGGAGDDVLSGSIGNDTIYAGPGLDRVGCGPGDDTAYVGPGDTVRACEHVHRSR
jgi:RTX calcium-binding nonapeptide repeat (4 copies)/WD40-like Beta Propeller Repeat